MAIKCAIKGCIRLAIVGWYPKNQMEKALRVCDFHLDKHLDKKNSFNFWDIVKVKKPKSRKEELLEAGIKVTNLAFGGTKVQCEKCNYQGCLIAEVSNFSMLKCPECNGKLSPKRYAYNVKCKNCGNKEGMNRNDLDLSQLRCSNCKKTGTSFYIKERCKKMSKKKVKVKRAKTKVHKKVEVKKDPGPRLSGKLSGVGVKATWIRIFKENPRHKLTEKQISTLMHKNFPNRKSGTFDHPQIHRNLYNKGLLTNGDVPKMQSRKYA